MYLFPTYLNGFAAPLSDILGFNEGSNTPRIPITHEGVLGWDSRKPGKNVGMSLWSLVTGRKGRSKLYQQKHQLPQLPSTHLHLPTPTRKTSTNQTTNGWGKKTPWTFQRTKIIRNFPDPKLGTPYVGAALGAKGSWMQWFSSTTHWNLF